jgi:hypothetical protein
VADTAFRKLELRDYAADVRGELVVALPPQRKLERGPGQVLAAEKLVVLW